MITTKSDGTKVVHNGYGTTGLQWHMEDRKVVLEMSQIPMTNIGSSNWHSIREHEVELRFSNVDSIDEFIDSLVSMKSMLRRNTL